MVLAVISIYIFIAFIVGSTIYRRAEDNNPSMEDTERFAFGGLSVILGAFWPLVILFFLFYYPANKVSKTIVRIIKHYDKA